MANGWLDTYAPPGTNIDPITGLPPQNTGLANPKLFPAIGQAIHQVFIQPKLDALANSVPQPGMTYGEQIQENPETIPSLLASSARAAGGPWASAGSRRNTLGAFGGRMDQPQPAGLARIPLSELPQGMVSPRYPTGKNPTFDPSTTYAPIDLKAMQEDPAAFGRNMNVLRSVYPFLTGAEKKLPDEDLAHLAIGRMRDNLLWIHDNAFPPDVMHRAAQWYDGANAIAKERAGIWGLQPQTAAGVYARLSPGKDWFQNVSLGDRMMEIYRSHQGTDWSPEMSGIGDRIWPKNPRWQPFYDSIKGKKLGDIEDPVEHGMWIRTFDEAHHPQNYQVVSPEGGMMDFARNKNGAPSRAAWQDPISIGKAVQMMRHDGDTDVITRNLGDAHKIRNFHNNIINPNNPHGDYTSDTHNVAAALLKPVAQTDIESLHNFGSTVFPEQRAAGVPNTSSPVNTGASGLYGLYADAGRQAAAQRGWLPRQMQSITWEGIRGLFPDTYKTAGNKSAINGMWDRFHEGGMHIDDLRAQIHEHAKSNKPTGRGFELPDWAGR